MIVRYEGQDRYAMSGYELYLLVVLMFAFGWVLGSAWSQIMRLIPMVFPEVVYE